MALEHIVMHVALCKAVARLAPRTTVAMRLIVSDKAGRTQLDRVVRFRRGTGDDTPAEFDSSFGMYRIDVLVPKYRCSAVDYIEILPDHDRSVKMRLVDGLADPRAPVLVMGSLPVSFAYTQPAVVIFPASVQCKGPVTDPITENIDNQIEQDAYYSALRAPALYKLPIAVTVALQLKDASGGYHYVRMPWKFVSGYGWPNVMEVNIDDAFVGSIAQEPEDTLLCPKGYLTIIN